MIYLLRVGDLLGVVFVLVEWEVVDLGKGACLWVPEKVGVLMILGSSGMPRVKVGLWIRSYWNWVL